MNIITKYFPELTTTQQQQMQLLQPLYEEWNAKINVISRKDIQNLYEHHVLHSLAIARIVNFRAGTRVMDIGCGGGFPGIPLAILFPETEFLLVDSIGKKVRVAQAVADSIGLKNVQTLHARGEEIKGRAFDFVVSRAVMPLANLVKCVRRLISHEPHNALPNGLIVLKGGELAQEIGAFRHISTVWNINEEFSEEYFETKKIVHVAL
ncbi:MAG: 16S rRNA (guanine(527)-N(7))-methyltransferase RsmG [Bacteroidales bacterium]|nr:16S rRNA (guanine(527)-N(7))-methyltransferase RsmG [Bacteroidales bacterium]